MKKTVLILVAILMLATSLSALPLNVLAEPEEGGETPTPVENVNVSIESVSPTTMLSGGNVTLKIVVTNSGDEIQNAVLSIGGSSVANYGTIAAGTSKTYDGTYAITESNLGKDIEVRLSYSFDGANKSQSRTFKVNKQAASVGVSLQASADQTSVSSGTKVKFTFAVENTGNVAITNLSIKANGLNNGNALPNVPSSIAAGKSSVVTYTQEVTADLNVTASLTYTADGKSNTQNFSSISVTVSEAAISVVATPSTDQFKTNEDVTFNIQIKNTGDVDLTGLQLKDSFGNTVSLKKTSLAKNDTLEAEHVQAFTEDTSYSFTLTGKDSSGNAHEFDSNITNVMLSEVAYDDVIDFTVTAELKDYAKNNKVVFNFYIKNNSDLTFTNIEIFEETLGMLDEDIDLLAPGQTEEFKAEATIDKDGELVFELLLTDPDGNVATISSNAVKIEEDGKSGSSLGTLLIIIIVIVVLMIAAGITLFVLKRKEKKTQEEAMGTGSRVTRKTPTDGTRARTQASNEERPRNPQQTKPRVEELEERQVRRKPEPEPPKKINKRPDFTDRNHF